MCGAVENATDKRTFERPLTWRMLRDAGRVQCEVRAYVPRTAAARSSARGKRKFRLQVVALAALFGTQRRCFIPISKRCFTLFVSFEVRRHEIVVNELHLFCNKKVLLFSYSYAIMPLIDKSKNYVHTF